VESLSEPPVSVPSANVRYAGFWIRALALLLDTLVLVAGTGVLAGAIAAVSGEPVAGPSRPMAFLAQWGYYAGFESSSWRATPGKRICSLIVVDTDGRQLSLGRASVRYAAELLSGLLLCIGYVMAAFTARKQALHDLVAGTVVLRNS
jgi:uncharacterized RDD family membrane protein YckC